MIIYIYIIRVYNIFCLLRTMHNFIYVIICANQIDKAISASARVSCLYCSLRAQISYNIILTLSVKGHAKRWRNPKSGKTTQHLQRALWININTKRREYEQYTHGWWSFLAWRTVEKQVVYCILNDSQHANLIWWAITLINLKWTWYIIQWFKVRLVLFKLHSLFIRYRSQKARH